MADGEEHTSENWLFYRDRPEWNDVTPIPQDEGPNAVVAIAYSPRFRDVYDYFRAIYKANEKSPRALKLTADALDLNPANYTVWQYRYNLQKIFCNAGYCSKILAPAGPRVNQLEDICQKREILKEIGADLKEELKYLEKVIDDNPKNYQVWHHRSVIVDWLKDPSEELKFTEKILEEDAKNYHAWQHRQWVMRTFKLYENELTYIEKLLNEDVRNNSAWNQRYFVVNNTTDFTPAILEREINFTIEKIKKATHNESAWNYLRGLLIHHNDGTYEYPKVEEFCEELYDEGNRSLFLLSFLIDLYGEQIEKNNEDQAQKLQRAVQMCEELSKEHDAIRSNYCSYMAKIIEKFQ